MQPAQDLIQHLRSEVLQVDPEWSVDIRGGFSWWPHQQRQDIVCNRVRKTEEGTRLERVCVSMEVAWLKPGAAIPDGLRHVPDEIANIVDTVVRPLGAGDPPWPANLFANLQEEYFDGPPCLLATSGEQGLTAEFPFGTASSIVLASTSGEHPSFGRGLLVRNGFHIDSVDPALISDPITLNGWDAEHSDGPFFASWTQVKNGRIDFITSPNALPHPNAAADFILIVPGRARRMSIRWLNDDWSETWDEEDNCRAKTAVQRAIAAGEIDPEKL